MQKTVHGDIPVASQECMKISGGGVCVCVVVFFIDCISVSVVHTLNVTVH